MKKFVQSHSANKKFGMGDNYGTGIRNKIGKNLDSTVGMIPVTQKGIKKPPKSLA